MAGQALETAFFGFAGVYGDRLFAFHSDSAEPGFPYLTAREQRQMLRCHPHFTNPDMTAAPPDLAGALSEAPGMTPVYADQEAMAVEIETPDGDVLAPDDPALAERLNEKIGRKHTLSLL